MGKKNTDQQILTIMRSINFKHTNEITESLDQIAKQVSDYLDVCRVGIWIYENDPKSSECLGIKCHSLYAKTENLYYHDILILKKEYPTYFEALENERNIEASDANNHEATKCFSESYLKPLKIKSMFDTPIWNVDHVIGVLCLEYTSKKESWSSDEKYFITAISDHIGKLYEKKAYLNLIDTLEEKVNSRTSELSSALSELKNAQEMIISKEKLASLGALTAGIAHEIKNPLNLITNSAKILDNTVKNLKELNKETVEDIKTMTEIIVDSVKRADLIIKNMLEQSRNDDIFIPSSINSTIQEAIKLSYHAMRANFKLELAPFVALSEDEDISHSKISMQRALINLLDNSFYALNEKFKNDSSFQPEINITSKKHENSLEITISDNGMGIEKSKIKKILEPFFTTKPTGQGTGLGLSMVYDIVKRHGGNLYIDSEIGQFFTTKITLPLK